jgi:hypothetical protein
MNREVNVTKRVQTAQGLRYCHDILAPVAFVCNRRRKSTEEWARLVTIGGEQHEGDFADLLGGDILWHHAEGCVVAVEGII